MKLSLKVPSWQQIILALVLGMGTGFLLWGGSELWASMLVADDAYQQELRQR